MRALNSDFTQITFPFGQKYTCTLQFVPCTYLLGLCTKLHTHDAFTRLVYAAFDSSQICIDKDIKIGLGLERKREDAREREQERLESEGVSKTAIHL